MVGLIESLFAPIYRNNDHFIPTSILIDPEFYGHQVINAMSAIQPHYPLPISPSRFSCFVGYKGKLALR